MESATCELNPIHNQIIFDFIEETQGGRFNTKTQNGLFVLEQADKQVDYCRWGRVLAVGPTVEDITVGDIVLIEKLMWTSMFRVTTKEYWVTSEDKILALWDNPSVLPS
jgi:co-chaperonin GroES (HSP10)